MGFYSPLSYPKTVINRNCWCGKVISYELEKEMRKRKKGLLVTSEMEEKGVAVSCRVTPRHCTGEQLSGKPVHSPTAFTTCIYSVTQLAVLLKGGRGLCGIRSTHNPTTNSFSLPSVHSFIMLCTGSTVGQA